MKQPLSFRIAADLLAAMRDCDLQDNRSLANFIETALIARIAAMKQDRSSTGPALPDQNHKATISGA
ncbi:hypothetical protein [Lichenifustis flavocetrariae]|uniref:Uncharacterized protein n=1 Tax=Lichenifustis flavocetrariae TaxID=2949735 RepID=A0AA42CMT8_9HYPH|nr:hypothetical protein [Lichenifustis flavocetrariae]MCW6511926.1 hypothetical protein [Lichenifustis flavocetrariae]